MESINADRELLAGLYRDTQIGAESTGTLIHEAMDPELKTDLSAQLCEYQKLSKKAKELLNQQQVHVAPPSTMKSLSIHTGIKLNTMMDKTSSHIAEIAIEGSTMGIVGTTKQLKQFSQASKEAKRLGTEVIRNEQKNIEILKQYL